MFLVVAAAASTSHCHAFCEHPCTELTGDVEDECGACEAPFECRPGMPGFKPWADAPGATPAASEDAADMPHGGQPSDIPAASAPRVADAPAHHGARPSRSLCEAARAQAETLGPRVERIVRRFSSHTPDSFEAQLGQVSELDAAMLAQLKQAMFHVDLMEQHVPTRVVQMKCAELFAHELLRPAPPTSPTSCAL